MDVEMDVEWLKVSEEERILKGEKIVLLWLLLLCKFGFTHFFLFY